MKNLKFLGVVAVASAFFFIGCQDNEFETQQFTEKYLKDNPKVAEKLEKWCEENKHNKMKGYGMQNCQLMKIISGLNKATGKYKKEYGEIGY